MNLAYTPEPRDDHDLDLTPRERRRRLLGWAIAALICLGFVALMALAGGGPT
jgi:hypothetical protein